MRADGNAPGRSGLEGAQDPGRVTGMETAGHVGAADHIENRLVIAHAPGAEAFTEVTVEVYRRHFLFSEIRLH